MSFMPDEDDRLRAEVEKAREAHRLALLAMREVPLTFPDFDSARTELKAAAERYEAAMDARLKYLREKTR
jgi:hypothetical protein